jgi:excisionase family DNA binding protein
MTETMTIETGLRALLVEVAREVLREELAKMPRREEFLSTAKAAAHAQVAAGTIRRWIRERRLVGYRAGRQVRVRREDLDKLLRSGPSVNANQLTPEQLARRDFG